MDKYAVIKLGSAQYKVSEGDSLTVQKQNGSVSADVLLYSDGKEIVLGDPTVKNAHIKIKVVGEKRGEKIVVSRFKSKSRYRKTRGYRDDLSVLLIEKIELGTPKKEAEDPKSVKEEVKKPKATAKVKPAAPKKTAPVKKAVKRVSKGK